MNVPEKKYILKDGREALFRRPCEEDAEEMLRFIKQASGETDFLLKYPEEFAAFTIEQERDFIMGARNDPDKAMIVCLVEGKIAGNCLIAFRTGIKNRHRASVAIGLLKEYWDLGIGTKMFEEMIRIAEERGGVRQLELEFIEGNNRARALYEKMGFRITGVIPDATRLKDGTFLNDYMMVKLL